MSSIDYCAVCHKVLRRGQRFGFTPLHSGCVSAWKEMTPEQRKLSLDKARLKTNRLRRVFE